MVKNKQGLHIARKIFRVQLVVLLVTAIIVLLSLGANAAMSVILGGLVNVFPNVCFARLLFKEHGAQAAKQIVKNFYKGEAVKMMLTVGLFALTFKYLNVIPLVFFAGFILAQISLWFAQSIVK
jgi:ATP synthase protein I